MSHFMPQDPPAYTEALLQRYQPQAIETALPQARSFDYLVPGLVAEVGEVLGKRAKASRDGWGTTELRESLLAELGDVAWMAACLLHLCEIEGYQPKPARPVITSPHREPETTLLELSASLYHHYSEQCHTSETFEYRQDVIGRHLATGALQIWAVLEAITPRLTGHPFDIALAHNVTKLAARAKRGTLRGSGDYR